MSTINTQSLKGLEQSKIKQNKVLSFSFCQLNSFKGIEKIVSEFYNKTNEKLSIDFLGSKGYLAIIEFNPTGTQSNNNRIDYFLLSNYKGKICINIYYCERSGISVEVVALTMIEKLHFDKLKNNNLKNIF